MTDAACWDIAPPHASATDTSNGAPKCSTLLVPKPQPHLLAPPLGGAAGPAAPVALGVGLRAAGAARHLSALPTLLPLCRRRCLRRLGCCNVGKIVPHSRVAFLHLLAPLPTRAAAAAAAPPAAAAPLLAAVLRACRGRRHQAGAAGAGSVHAHHHAANVQQAVFIRVAVKRGSRTLHVRPPQAGGRQPGVGMRVVGKPLLLPGTESPPQPRALRSTQENRLPPRTCCRRGGGGAQPPLCRRLPPVWPGLPRLCLLPFPMSDQCCWGMPSDPGTLQTPGAALPLAPHSRRATGCRRGIAGRLGLVGCGGSSARRPPHASLTCRVSKRGKCSTGAPASCFVCSPVPAQ